MTPIVEKLKEAKLECPIVSCFGNDDYDSIKDTLRTQAKDIIRFLDDELRTFTIRGKKVSVIGSRGVLDNPTFWQSRNIEGIRELYTKRVGILDSLLEEAKTISPFTILLTHYTSTFVTKGYYELFEAKVGIVLHYMPENRLATDFHHCLWHSRSFFTKAGAQASSENGYPHVIASLF